VFSCVCSLFERGLCGMTCGCAGLASVIDSFQQGSVGSALNALCERAELLKGFWSHLDNGKVVLVLDE
jgi:hypothetical protein